MWKRRRNVKRTVRPILTLYRLQGHPVPISNLPTALAMPIIVLHVGFLFFLFCLMKREKLGKVDYLYLFHIDPSEFQFFPECGRIKWVYAVLMRKQKYVRKKGEVVNESGQEWRWSNLIKLEYLTGRRSSSSYASLRLFSFYLSGYWMESYWKSSKTFCQRIQVVIIRVTYSSIDGKHQGDLGNNRGDLFWAPSQCLQLLLGLFNRSEEFFFPLHRSVKEQRLPFHSQKICWGILIQFFLGRREKTFDSLRSVARES